MKKEKMELLSSLNSNNSEIKSYTITEIAMLLERNSYLLKGKFSASMFWAIGKAYPTIGLPGLIKVTKSNWKMFSDEISYQTLIALENFLDNDEVKNTKENLLLNDELMSFIRSKCKSTNTRLSECSNRVLSKLTL
mgnify:FL=1